MSRRVDIFSPISLQLFSSFDEYSENKADKSPLSRLTLKLVASRLKLKQYLSWIMMSFK